MILPEITSVTPINAATNVAINSTITATFSVAMDPATMINTAAFTLQKGAIPVTGTVTYSGTTATFTPLSNLIPNIIYTATISTGAKSTLDVALESNYSWSFKTARDYTAWIDQGIVYSAPFAGDAYYPSVIYDANGFGSGTPGYAMWYTNGSGSVFLTTSIDGLVWGAPATMTGLVNAHHVQVLYDMNCFGAIPCNAGTPKYKMWFWDITKLYEISSIATAKSADGINWVNQAAVTQNAAAKLIQDPDTGVGWNRGTYGPVNLFYQANALNTGTEPWNYSYVMYYDGTDGSVEETGLAYSTDGSYWNAYTVNPVLDGSSVGAWDCKSSVYGTIYKDSAGAHYFYSGKGEDDGIGGCTFPVSGNFDGIGYAYSADDGKTWTKSTANPIFHVNDGMPYRDDRIYTPSVVDDGTGILKMYYSAKEVGGPKKIGLAILN